MIIPNIWENKTCSKPPTRYPQVCFFPIQLSFPGDFFLILFLFHIWPPLNLHKYHGISLELSIRFPFITTFFFHMFLCFSMGFQAFPHVPNVFSMVFLVFPHFPTIFSMVSWSPWFPSVFPKVPRVSPVFFCPSSLPQRAKQVVRPCSRVGQPRMRPEFLGHGKTMEQKPWVQSIRYMGDPQNEWYIYIYNTICIYIYIYTFRTHNL